MSSKSIENTEQVRELERAILGGLMLETERYDAVSEIIEFTDFEGQDHQNIFQSMGELVNSNKPLDPLGSCLAIRRALARNSIGESIELSSI